MITNTQSGTTVDEIAEGIYRISTPVHLLDGFTFNQYLVVDEKPLLFHSGPRRMFPMVREAIAKVIPLERLRYIGVSHFEADECGALNEILAVAPNAVPVCSTVGALVSLNDYADRDPLPLANGRRSSAGRPQPPMDRHTAPASRLGLRLYV
jgi:flavorubredoxin